MYMCVSGIDLASFYDFRLDFENVVFFFIHFMK
jgi:hypothetical protein